MAETEEEPGIEVQIEHAVRSRLQHFKDQADSLTLESVRRLLEKDMGIEKFSLDAHKRFIRQHLEKVLNSPKGAKAAKDVKTNSKSSRSKKSGKTSSEEGFDSFGGASDSMEDKVKSRKEAAHRKNIKLEEVKKRKRSTEGDFDVSSTKQNKLAKRRKEGDSESDDAGNVSDDSQSKLSVEKPRKEKPAPGYGRKVEHLKSVIKACGMSVAPSIYKKAKQVSDEKREAFIVKELEGILIREGLSKDPNEKDALWQMNPRSREQMEPGSYPVREDEPDCSYYIRTGLCRFGATCRFNHPPNRKLAIATARMRGEYPERIGQPECQYYLKTGTCKFGATCKFHHPRDKAGIAGRVALNALGYPFRPNESECAYFMRNGHCKFGSTCKFHHPQPSNMMFSLRGSSVYPPIHSPTAGQLSFPLSRASFIPSSRWQNPSSYSPMVVPQGVVSVPGWNLYTGQLGSVSPSENQRPIAGSSLADGASPQGEVVNAGSQFRSGTLQLGQYAFQRDNVFPERPGQPECQFYMKTGDCKFGAVCKFHHPTERFVPFPDCVLSPLGLPLRPGEPLCVFYSRYGICKFGPSCKFDHPMRAFAYNTAASSSTDSPAVRRFLASTGAVALSLAPDGLVEARQKPSGSLCIGIIDREVPTVKLPKLAPLYPSKSEK
ncbi:zinc finger CCCH domain-containing protein ZFN-like [Primulina huaijiensis]|uniref:zinc finger CCCH domain-containing protein ZFN-like n=1 Tax=Primulina huaijiensis TaxID=1492673 RepID=UPI003CC79C19